MSWTDERVSELKQFADAGLTASQIGSEMGITRNSVIGKLGRLGVALAGAWTVPMIPRARPTPTEKPAPKPRQAAPQYTVKRTVIRPARAGIYGGEVEVVDVPEAIDLPPDESPFACTIVDLTDATCRWPIGHPSNMKTFRYCGDQATGGKVYCHRHHWIAHKPYGARG